MTHRHFGFFKAGTPGTRSQFGSQVLLRERPRTSFGLARRGLGSSENTLRMCRFLGRIPSIVGFGLGFPFSSLPEFRFRLRPLFWVWTILVVNKESRKSCWPIQPIGSESTSKQGPEPQHIARSFDHCAYSEPWSDLACLLSYNPSGFPSFDFNGSCGFAWLSDLV